ncbi:MAG: SemiSWEET transporter [Spirochaetia bacterium]|nr:SemiSWEET transporter [Spirochaetota bacterium]MCX8096270.1 SemiSWEET transporter [Spirochaetota bacterium]MDW8113290.1 SemiSWEET transporter [Spirochaetia bacterium]
MDRVFVEAIGIIAGTLTTISFIPQLLKVVKTKSARDISLLMFIIFTTGILLWLVYGIITRSIAIILANTFTFSIALSILILKIKYDRASS